MSFKQLPDKKALDQEFRRRADFDFIKRALPGVLLYICAWPIVFFWTGFADQRPHDSIIFGTIFTVTSLLRLLHGQLTARIYDHHYAIWNSSLTFLCLVHAGAWGILFYLANLNPAYAEISGMVNLVIAGIATGSVQSLIPKYNLTRIYIAFVILPTILATVLAGQQYELGFICVLFWLYLAGVGKRFRREYERAFVIEKELYQNQKELKELNRTDPLTKSRNRRDFDEQIKEAWEHAIETQKTISILMFDIDHFKNINDSHGHPMGDQCLKQFTKTIGPLINDNAGNLFRYGGEEFSTIILCAEESEAVKLAEDARKRVENSPVVADDITVSMTMSVGICWTVADNAKSVEQALESADQALYKAKQSGRNQVILNKLN